MAMEHIYPEIQNVVSTASLNHQINLKVLARKVLNIEYNAHRWAPAAIIRIRKPNTTALIFGSGKSVCTGAKPVNESRTAARKFARKIQNAGFPIKF